jgi:hypothetical protein
MTKIPAHSTIFWDPKADQYYTTTNNSPTGSKRSYADPYVLGSNGKPVSLTHLIGKPKDGQPTSGAGAPQYVLVQPGDSEWTIAQDYAKSGEGAKLWGNDVVPGNIGNDMVRGQKITDPNLIYAGDIAVIKPSQWRAPEQAGTPAKPAGGLTSTTIQARIASEMTKLGTKPTTTFFKQYVSSVNFPLTLKAMGMILVAKESAPNTVRPWIRTFLGSLTSTQHNEAEKALQKVITSFSASRNPNYSAYGVAKPT